MQNSRQTHQTIEDLKPLRKAVACVGHPEGCAIL